MFIILCATPCIKRELKGRKADKKEESSSGKDVKNRMRKKGKKDTWRKPGEGIYTLLLSQETDSEAD